MALSTRLNLRQGQSLVMTPQLLQAIKLLQLSSIELSAYVEQELERNPLLERQDDESGPVQEAAPVSAGEGADEPSDSAYDDAGDFDADRLEAREGDWASESLSVDSASLGQDLGTEVSNAFDEDVVLTNRLEGAESDPAMSADAWTGASMSQPSGSSMGPGEDAPDLEAYVAGEVSLGEHLERQLAIAIADPLDRLIGRMLIDALDEAGYMRAEIAEMAERLNVSEARILNVLTVVQTFEPAGIAARDLAECLAIQLRDRDRFDPAMQALVANLPLLARRDFVQLRKLCGVDQEDMADMIAELRALDPKPGRAFADSRIQAVAPDVSVRAAADGSWQIELNPSSMPRILVNQTYSARVARGKMSKDDQAYIAECLQNANWLTRSLEQRARTILKVATEIVRQQDGFFAYGLEHLRPLNLKTVADAIGMHESTVSRVTSNKYLFCSRGLFEFKFFFSASIPAQAGGEAHSSEAVRHRIKQMVENESANDILSDDAIVLRLKELNIDIARRTVAKYRESLRIPSSVERRRERQMQSQGV